MKKFDFYDEWFNIKNLKEAKLLEKNPNLKDNEREQVNRFLEFVKTNNSNNDFLFVSHLIGENIFFPLLKKLPLKVDEGFFDKLKYTNYTRKVRMSATSYSKFIDGKYKTIDFESKYGYGKLNSKKISEIKYEIFRGIYEYKSDLDLRDSKYLKVNMEDYEPSIAFGQYLVYLNSKEEEKRDSRKREVEEKNIEIQERLEEVEERLRKNEGCLSIMLLFIVSISCFLYLLTQP